MREEGRNRQGSLRKEAEDKGIGLLRLEQRAADRDQSPRATCIVGKTHESSNGRVGSSIEAHERKNGTNSIVNCKRSVRNAVFCLEVQRERLFPLSGCLWFLLLDGVMSDVGGFHPNVRGGVNSLLVFCSVYLLREETFFQTSEGHESTTPPSQSSIKKHRCRTMN